jgi:hypothetical protein
MSAAFALGCAEEDVRPIDPSCIAPAPASATFDPDQTPVVARASQEEEQQQTPVPLVQQNPPAPAVADSFWAYEAWSDRNRPRPWKRRSISLGYIGDQPLSGGVMRDTPMPSAAVYGNGLSWQQYAQQRSWPSNPTYYYSSPSYRYYRYR